MSKCTVSTNLLNLMKKHKVTIAELSKATGIAEITINKLRNDQNSNPTISTIIPIANYFNITVDELLTSEQMTINVCYEDNTELIDELQINKIKQGTDFAIKVTNANYSEFKKDSILLINRIIKIKNGDYIVIKTNNCFVFCRAIVELGDILGESLSRKESVYKINQKDFFGVIIGVLWLRN